MWCAKTLGTNRDKDNKNFQFPISLAMRIAGVDLPEDKATWFALTRIYGIGRNNVSRVLELAKVEPAKRTGDLTSQEVARLSGILAKLKIEGNLRREVADNIKRLKRIGAYRGQRHSRNLPVRGQRTRSNARTKRGKRMTIGALKKKDLAKLETQAKQKEEVSKAQEKKK